MANYVRIGTNNPQWNELRDTFNIPNKAIAILIYIDHLEYEYKSGDNIEWAMV